MLTYNFNSHLSVEASWHYDIANNHTPDLAGIAYRHNVALLRVAYNF